MNLHDFFIYLTSKNFYLLKFIMRIKKMAAGWAINLTVLLFIMGLIMLAVLLFLAISIKPPQDSYTAGHFDEEFLNKAANYNRSSLLLSIVQRFLLWVLMSSMIIILWRFPFANKRAGIAMAFALFAAFVIILEIIILPLQYYRGFVLEHRFGLSNQTFLAWFSDILKEKAISLIINSSLMTIIYSLIIYVPKH